MVIRLTSSQGAESPRRQPSANGATNQIKPQGKSTSRTPAKVPIPRPPAKCRKIDQLVAHCGGHSRRRCHWQTQAQVQSKPGGNSSLKDVKEGYGDDRPASDVFVDRGTTEATTAVFAQILAPKPSSDKISEGDRAQQVASYDEQD